MLLVLRCVAQAVLPLMHQEAYYWMYAQHPSLSYFDHPPMVAWMIRATTGVFGDNEWGVRFGSGAFMAFNGVLMYAFARQWWGRAVAVAAAVFLEVSPVYFGIGLLGTMDAPLLTFWLVGLIGFSAAVRRGRTWAWYLCGFGLGGALLSKYTGVYLIPGVGLLVLTHPPWRKYLRSPHPYLAVLLGMAMFAPVVVWNFRHDWVSFKFQFLSRFDADTSGHRHTFLEFVALQLAVATPFVIGGMLVLHYRWTRRRRLPPREKVALAFALPLLLSVAAKAVHYPIHIDWTAPVYLGLIPATLQLVAVRMRTKRKGPVRYWNRSAVALTLQACMAVDLGLVLLLLFVQPQTHWFRQFGPWDDISARVETYEDALEARTGSEPLVIVDGKYELASLIAFYRNRREPEDNASQTTVNQVALGGEALGFSYWTDRRSWRGKDCIFVDTNSDVSTRLNGWFTSVTIKWTGLASNGVRYTISECHDYRG